MAQELLASAAILVAVSSWLPSMRATTGAPASWPKAWTCQSWTGSCFELLDAVDLAEELRDDFSAGVADRMSCANLDGACTPVPLLSPRG